MAERIFDTNLRIGGPSGPLIIAGSGSPEGVVTAPVGSGYLRTDGSTGTSHYRKESGAGNTGWVATASAGGGGVTDGDKGDVLVASSGLSWTLQPVNSDVGSFGLPWALPNITVDAKGRVIAAQNVAIEILTAAISDSTVVGREMLTAETPAEQTALLEEFTDVTAGLAPRSGGGTSKFLRADKTWAPPLVANGLVSVTAPNNSREWSQTVAAVGVAASQRIFLSLAAADDADENDAEMLDAIAMSAVAGTDQITIEMAFSAPVAGAIKLNWMAL